MKVNEVNDNFKLLQSKRIKAQSKVSSAFSGLLGGVGDSDMEVSQVAHVAEAASINPLNALNFIDGFSESEAQKKAIEYGKDMLRSLETLKKALILGVLEYNTLQNIQVRLNNIKVETADAELKSLLEEIKTRAVVEIEKQKKYQQNLVSS